MEAFFSGARPGRTVTHGGATFELPILYRRDDCFLVFHTADLSRLRARMPTPALRPVPIAPGRGLVGIVAFNYIETTIGPYGEVGVVIPVVYGKAPAVPLLPVLLESRFPGFGMLVAHLPVTNTTARDAGRGEWGYPKFVADMEFRVTPELLRCRLSEKDAHILTVQVRRSGLLRTDTSPLVSYTVRDGALIRTRVAQRGTYRMSLHPRGSTLELGRHEVAEWIRDLDLSSVPVQTRYYLERSAILPAGEAIEDGVEPLDGYRGSDRAGRHEVVYTEGA